MNYALHANVGSSGSKLHPLRTEAITLTFECTQHVMRPAPYDDESVTSYGGAHAVRGAIINDHLLQK